MIYNENDPKRGAYVLVAVLAGLAVTFFGFVLWMVMQ